MTAELEYRKDTWPGFDLGMLGGVKLDYETGVFRRYHVGNRPTMFIDPLGLSTLTFDRGSGTLTLYDGSGNQVGQYPAANNAASNSNGPWPNGTYDYLYQTPHPDSGPTGPYGSNGNFVFDVPDRPGMGVHSGRNGPDSPTMGCIRTTDEGTAAISNLNAQDPPTSITVK